MGAPALTLILGRRYNPPVLALLAAVGFGSGAVFARLGLRGMKPATGTAISLIVSFSLTAVLALAIERSALFTLPAIALVWFLVLGIVNYPLARLMNYTSVNLVGASRSAPIISTAPLFSAVLAIIFLGEEMNLLVGLGTAAIVVGSILIVVERTRAPS